MGVEELHVQVIAVVDGRVLADGYVPEVEYFLVTHLVEF